MYCQGKEEIRTSLEDSINIMKLIFAAKSLIIQDKRGIII